MAAAAAADRSSGRSDHAVQSKDRCHDHDSLLSQARVEITNHVSGSKLAKNSSAQAEQCKQKPAVKARKEDWEVCFAKLLKIQRGGAA